MNAIVPIKKETSLIRRFFKLPLPVIMATLLVVGTLGIVVAAFLTTRTINVVPMDAISITPEVSETCPIVRGESAEVVYQVTNNSSQLVSMQVTNLTSDPELTIDISPAEFDLGPGESAAVTVLVTASESATDCVLNIQFQQVSTS